MSTLTQLFGIASEVCAEKSAGVVVGKKAAEASTEAVAHRHQVERRQQLKDTKRVLNQLNRLVSVLNAEASLKLASFVGYNREESTSHSCLNSRTHKGLRFQSTICRKKA